MNDRAFCEAMLPRVSRTFALCIRLLPPDLEYPILVAYLLCRIADTLEDTADLDAATKGELLHHFGAWLADDDLGHAPLRDTFARCAGEEELLTHHADAVVREFRRLPDEQQACILPWVQEMTAGMATFAERRDSPGHAGLTSLNSVEDLERYCYYVAGTVGHMLTALYQTGGREFDESQARRLEHLATSFGLGLQLTNIIKDIADDQERGWSFVPMDLCRAVDIEPHQLHDPVHRGAAQSVMRTLIDKAARHLDDARTYTKELPHREYRIRLFCLTSMYFAVRTLALARRDDRLLDPDRKLKISRSAVYATVTGAAVVAPSNRLIDAYFRHLSAVTA